MEEELEVCRGSWEVWGVDFAPHALFGQPEQVMQLHCTSKDDRMLQVSRDKQRRTGIITVQPQQNTFKLWMTYDDVMKDLGLEIKKKKKRT